jgi:FKBP-type peptidyl-prolyl cis-trans isomerase
MVDLIFLKKIKKNQKKSKKIKKNQKKSKKIKKNQKKSKKIKKNQKKSKKIAFLNREPYICNIQTIPAGYSIGETANTKTRERGLLRQPRAVFATNEGQPPKQGRHWRKRRVLVIKQM